MSLEEINKELYDPDSKIEKRTHSQNPFDPRVVSGEDGRSFQVEENWIEERKGLSDKQRKIIKIAIIVAAAAALSFSLYFFVSKFLGSAFSEDRVIVDIEGPESVNSNELAAYVIKYRNNNRASLKNAVLFLNYSSNFQPEQSPGLEIINSGNSRVNLGKIGSYDAGQTEIKGKFYAPRNHIIYIKVTMEYVPSNFNSIFHSEKQIGVNVRTSPFNLEINAPLEAADGNEVEYIVDYKNMSATELVDISLKAEFPPGFEYISAEPKPNENNNFWYLGNISANQGGKIKVKGLVKGTFNEGKVIRFLAGSSSNGGQFVIYTEAEKVTKMIASPFFISQKVKDSDDHAVNIGQDVNYTISYRNNSNIGIRDAIVTFEMQSRVLDYAKINLEKGHYDGKRNIITWKAVDYPQLANVASGAGGEISFSIPIMARIPVNNESDKNFTITTIAKIDSPDVPSAIGANKIISTNTLTLKLNTKIFLETAAYYKDANMQNTGPLPPVAGEETTYTIRWRILNVVNDAAGAKIVSSLPNGIRWTGKFFPESESLSFNERTNQLIWNIGRIPAGTGIINPKREVGFQIGVNPQINQDANDIVLLNKSILMATDLFTSRELKAESERIEGKQVKE